MLDRSPASDPARPASRRLSASWPLSTLAVVALVACRDEAPLAPLPGEGRPLAELATSVRRVVETAAIDVGEPASRAHLSSGWGPDETSAVGSFAWSGGAATLRFEVVEPRDRVLGLRGWAYPAPGVETRRVELLLNGVDVGEVDLGLAPETFRVPVEAARFAAGENLLELRADPRPPTAGAPTPAAPWEVAWDAVRFDAEADSPSPPSLADDGAWLFPARTAVEWTAELPPDSWLAWDRVERTAGARPEISVRAERRRVHPVGGEAENRIRLTAPPTATDAASELVEVRLSALGPSGRIRVVGARIHSPSGLAGTVPPTDGTSAVSAPAAAPPTRPQPPNLVVYVIDTLRADHLGAYGYAVPTSPRIDAFAREAVLWREARAQSSWTKPAMATLLTGLYPIAHGADRRSRGLAPDALSIGARLAEAGYETAFFTTNPTVTAKFGFDRGFATYRYLSRQRGTSRARSHVDSGEIHREVVRWLAAREASRPFLLVVHTLDPHDPYTPPSPWKERFAPDVDAQVACCIRAPELAALSPAAARERARQMRALYDGEIARNDAAFGDLLDELERRELLERSAVVLTADHGEEFYDHGDWRHASTLYEEVLRIPFVLRLPGGAHGGRIVAEPADQIDLVPTLLDLAGLPLPQSLPGGSWLPALRGGAPPARDSFAWLEHPAFSIASATRDGWKGIWTRGGWRLPLERGPDELFELGADPHERADLTALRGLRRSWLAGLLAAEAARHGRATPATEVPIDPELDRSLRALGYF